MSVYDKGTGKPVPIGKYRAEGLHALCIDTNPRDVPLAPESYEPTLPAFEPPPPMGRRMPPGPHGEQWRATWHERQQYVAFTPAATNGATTAAVGPYLREPCTSKGQELSEAVDVGFRFPMEDPEQVDRALLATTACPDVRFTMAVEALHRPEAGQRTCVRGHWELVDTLTEPDAVVWQRKVNKCKAGPVDDRTVVPTDLEVPPGADPTGLEVRFRGEVSIQCRKPATERGLVLLQFPKDDYPRLSWPGCFPGWDPQSTP